MTTRILNTTQAFKKLRLAWHQLLEQAVINHPFMTPEFQETWWAAFQPGELQIVAVFTDEQETELVGLAPLFVDENENLSFVGCVSVSDYLDVIVHRDFQDAVYQALTHELQKILGSKKRLFLCSLPDNSPSFEYFSAAFPSLEKTQQDVAPQIELPQTWDTYLDSLDRKQRHEIRRKSRRVAEVEHEFVCLTHVEPADIETFMTLHQASSGDKKRFWNEEHTQFFTNLLPRFGEAGWLKLYFLKIEGQAVSSMLVFDYNNRYYLYNSGFYPDQYAHLGTGNVLTAHTIEQAIEQGRAVYDFLRGDEQYKFRFGAVAQPVWDLSYAPPTSS